MNKDSKRASFRKSRDHTIEGEKATCLEFGVLTLEGDGEGHLKNIPSLYLTMNFQSSQASRYLLVLPMAESQRSKFSRKDPGLPVPLQD